MTENENMQNSTPSLSPAVRFLIDTNRLDAKLMPASGRGGRILKGDILMYLSKSERGKEQAIAAAQVLPVRQPPPPIKGKDCPYVYQLLSNINMFILVCYCF